jgi:UDP-2,4-diacetamido-2,4,6-trideoxy-beta-L-altropyranose hydrolase/UDP-4-amino-4,6-dideoxy-N-acetyl-beta-L-altrosamine N-acetyltransferase
MRVVFRVDASLEIGSGHVMRCLALAEILKENGANVEFICRKHNGNLISNIISKGFSVLELKNDIASKQKHKLPHSHWLGSSQKQDSEDCLNFLKQSRVDWLIVDHYGIDEEWQIYLKGNYQKLMVIDDLADRNHQCDLLLDQTFNRQKKDYKDLVPESCELILGSQFALLRKEFNNLRNYSLDRRRAPVFKELLINMGAMDNLNTTRMVLEGVGNCNLPKDINVTVVMGGLSPHIESIQELAKKIAYRVVVKVEVNNLAEIMANSDIAIGASGTTTWERCCLGLPSIQFVAAENQIYLAENLSNMNIIKLVKEASELKDLLEYSSDWISNVSNSAQNICSGRGVYKIFNKLSDLKINLDNFGEVILENYVNTSMKDQDLILSMRNHSSIRKFMFNQKEISRDSHIKFIKALSEKADIRYFLVKINERVIGSINFSQINVNKSVEFGIYTNPFEKNNNTGRILEAAASNFAFNKLGVKKISLKVLADNKRAINFYKKSGFVLSNSKKFNKKDVYCMEKITRHIT